MPEFDNFISEVTNSIPGLARISLKGFADRAAKIGADFVRKAESDLKTWTAMLASGEIDAKQFESAVRGKAQVGKMTLLEIKGLSEAAVDEFMTGIVSSIVSSAVRLFQKV